jgi:hypothetical protein
MSPLVYLFLGHFIADYLFQPGILVAYKKNNFLGILIHGFIHLGVNLMLLSPFLGSKKVLQGILALFVIHMIFDQAKISLQKAHPHWNRFWVYFNDQLAHFISIVVIGIGFMGYTDAVMKEPFLSFYTNEALLVYLLSLVLTTYFWDVTRWTYENVKKERPYQRDYKMMLQNAALLTVALALTFI